MGYIFYIMGKSSSGKDTIYNQIKMNIKELKTVTLYTTRPIREGEEDGETYIFVSDEDCNRFCESGKVIELRSYDTVHGIWKYFTVDDAQMCLQDNSYLMIGTLESYQKMCKYYGTAVMMPIYVEVEDGLRLTRALEREKEQVDPKYAELCRRFLADTSDFSEEKLQLAGIRKRYENIVLEACINEIILYITENL